jgi:hypothetical protein
MEKALTEKTNKLHNTERERRQLQDVQSNNEVAAALHKSVQAQKQFSRVQLDDVLDDIDDNRDDTRDFSARLGNNAGDDDADIIDYDKMGMDDILAALNYDTVRSDRMLSADVLLAMQTETESLVFPAVSNKTQTSHMQ